MTPRDPRPDARELLLLRAGLLEGDAAREAWSAWRRDADLDRIDQASFRLLPLVHRNLQRLGVADRWDGAMRGFYRRAWCENQMLFRRLRGALDVLERAGIEALVLKGAALASWAYGDAGARPMADVDVLVRKREFVGAVDCLAREGWAPAPGGASARFAASPARFASRSTALGLRQDGDLLPTLDLHARMLHLYGRHGVDFPEERLFADAERFELAGRPALRLSDEHTLVHVCFHGFQRQDVGPIRWVADVDRLLRARSGKLRWGRLLRDARAARVLSPLRDALSFVAATLGTPVPARALAATRRAPLATVERLERALRLGEPALLADYGKSLAPALRLVRERGPVHAPAWGTLGREALRLGWKLPKRHARRAVSKAAARLRRAARGQGRETTSGATASSGSPLARPG